MVHIIPETTQSLEKVAAARGVRLEKKPANRWFNAFRILLYVAGPILGAAACNFVSTLPENPDQADEFDDDAGDNENDDVDSVTEVPHPPLPTSTPESGAVNDHGVSVQTYISEEIDFASMHLFNVDSVGRVVSTFGLISKNMAELDVQTEEGVTTVAMSGNDFSQPEGYVYSGDGYGAQETLSNAEMLEWLGGMEPSERNAETVQELIEYMQQNPDFQPQVTMTTTYNMNKSTQQLIDMGIDIEVHLPDGQVKIISSTLTPLEKMDVFKGQKIAAVDLDFGVDVINAEVAFEVVPDTWTEIEDGLYVSPEFIDLRDSVDQIEGYDVSNDGVIEFNGEPIPNLQMTVDGNYVILVGNEMVLLTPDDVVFDENGEIEVEGYELNAVGEWVELSSNIYTTATGLSVEVGEELPDGSYAVTILPPEKYDGNEAAQEKWLNYFDAERLGFDEGATQWIKTEDGRVILVDTADPGKVIAEHKHIDWLDVDGVVWNWENFVEGDGENVLFDVCPVWDLKNKGGAPVDKDGVLDYYKLIESREATMVRNGVDMMYGGEGEIAIGSSGGSILSSNGQKMVLYRQMRYSDSEGFLVTRDDKGNSILIYVENMDWDFYAN